MTAFDLNHAENKLLRSVLQWDRNGGSEAMRMVSLKTQSQPRFAPQRYYDLIASARAGDLQAEGATMKAKGGCL